MSASIPESLNAAKDAYSRQKYSDAENLCNNILRHSPDHPHALLLRGLAVAGLNRDDEAADIFRHVLRLQPSDTALFSLGYLYHKKDDRDQAMEYYNRALQLNPRFAQALNNRGNLWEAAKSYAAALADYDRAIVVDPGYVTAHKNRGKILVLLKQPHEALSAFQQAITLDPGNFAAYHECASLFSGLGNYPEASNYYRRALAINPDFAPSLNNLGNILKSQGKLHEAAALFRKAITVNPNGAEFYNNLANTLKDQGYLADAVEYYQKTLALWPDCADAYFNMGQTFHDMGDRAAAITAFEQAFALRPDYPEARWAHVMTHMPLIFDAPKNHDDVRRVFSSKLAELDEWFDAAHAPDGHKAVGITSPFHVAYQEENNLGILKHHGDLCVRLMREWQQRQGFTVPKNNRSGPVRLGIVSSHVRDHSVWHAVVKGWLQHLDPARIHITLFQIGESEDDETRWARQKVAVYKIMGSSLDAMVGTILQENLDVLIYPEIGMDAITLKLASMRLCPVQMASWGHPETSGLSTIDYYLSCQDFERTDAQDNYCEKLVNLPNLGCCYQSLTIDDKVVSRESLGIKEGGPLLLSPGVPFKYAPENDHVFVDLVKKIPACRIVFFTSRPQYVSHRLRTRLQKVFKAAGLDFDDNCQFIPWLDRSGFYALMKQADVFLDTLGFSGFNTAMQAVECALPVVTREGLFMRGRFATGIMGRMGLDDMVTATSHAYVDQVVRLVEDKAYYHNIKQQLIERRGVLFEDRTPVLALQKLLIDLAQRERQVGAA